MSGKMMIAVIAAAPSIAGAGWGAHYYLHDTFADKSRFMVVEAKADFVVDQQIASIIGQISYLERKPHKTAEELQQLNYLRGQLEYMRKVRAGK